MPRKTEIFSGKQETELRKYPDNHFGSLVTDPPYGYAFMGQKWDYDVPAVEAWKSVFRVMKPGAYGAVFCGTRTQHRMVVNIEDAGFEIRDVIAWVYGSGFPKSMDIGKAFDKAAGAGREVIGQRQDILTKQAADFKKGTRKILDAFNAGAPERNNGFKTLSADVTIPSTDEAKQWDGWGTALKPAMELITLIRKPLEGTVVNNIKDHGVGGINVDDCRVPPTGEDLGGGDANFNGKPKKAAEGWARPWMQDQEALANKEERAKISIAKSEQLGRFPANFIHDGSDEVLELFPESKGQQGAVKGTENPTIGLSGIYGKFAEVVPHAMRNDSGSAARFFYCAKPSPSERNAGCADGNKHTTVKPLKLMQYLVKLVTPPGEIVLDPYCGSGTTGCACQLEGFESVLIDQDEANCATTFERVNHYTKIAEQGKQLSII